MGASLPLVVLATVDRAASALKHVFERRVVSRMGHEGFLGVAWFEQAF
jgi:hypothetical protein